MSAEHQPDPEEDPDADDEVNEYQLPWAWHSDDEEDSGHSPSVEDDDFGEC